MICTVKVEVIYTSGGFDYYVKYLVSNSQLPLSFFDRL